MHYVGLGYNICIGQINAFDNLGNRQVVASIFARRLATETRIQGSNPAPAIALHQAPPTNPIHLLLTDEVLASDISLRFKRAFGHDLTAFRAGGGNFPLYVGTKPALMSGKDELSRDFVEELLSTNVPLEKQSDGMRSFASVLLHVLTSDAPSIQFLDEPEAFLHPPQARLLGRYIAENRRENSQLFISTRSADVLDGLIDGGLGNVRIVRIRREGSINRVKELDKEKTKEVAKDTLIRFSRVFDGIFFEHVIICESDADCMFYQCLLELRSISCERKPDVLFVHTSGKHRMVKLAETLRALDVPVSVIADIDILNEESPLEKLVTALGGEWRTLQPIWKALFTAITAPRPPLNAGQVAQLIEKQLEGISGLEDFPPEKAREIKKVLSSISSWSQVKQAGRSGIPSGEPTKKFNELDQSFRALGLWIVPVGELEGFCRSIGSHGPAFVEAVLEQRDLENDAELSEARSFIRDIWQNIREQQNSAPLTNGKLDLA